MKYRTTIPGEITDKMVLRYLRRHEGVGLYILNWPLVLFVLFLFLIVIPFCCGFAYNYLTN
jgi:hypothetical protein